MAVAEFRAASLQDYLKRVRELRGTWNKDPWFRGVTKASYRLIPRIYRDEHDEGELRADFDLLSKQLIERREPKDHWEQYFLMQHYGSPTRLLDWTDGALIALYFAVRHARLDGRRRKYPDSAVWVIDPSWLNRKSIGNRKIAVSTHPEVQRWLPQDPLAKNANKIGELPVAIEPPHVDRRLAVQRSRFTIFGMEKNGLMKIAASDAAARLAKVSVSGSRFKGIKEDLATCGIRETTLFPDLEGLGRQLAEDW